MNKERIQKATHEGEIDINGFKIKSYNLEDGQRVLSRIDFLRALGRTGKAKGGRMYDEEFKLPVFLTANNIKPFISSELEENSAPIIFKDLQGTQSIGYKAELLPFVCYVFIDANESNVLHKNQQHIAERSKILVRGFATIGIIALIDEATGYQYAREKNELQKILKAYISEELLPWHKRFPDEFYREIFRLNNWEFTVAQIKKAERPAIIGKWTKKYIYSVLPPGVLEALLNLTPRDNKGKLRSKLHQHLSREDGIEHLNKQIISVVTLMNVSDSWKQFERLWNKKFGQLEIPFTDLEIIEPKKQLKEKIELSDFDKKL